MHGSKIALMPAIIDTLNQWRNTAAAAQVDLMQVILRTSDGGRAICAWDPEANDWQVSIPDMQPDI